MPQGNISLIAKTFCIGLVGDDDNSNICNYWLPMGVFKLSEITVAVKFNARVWPNHVFNTTENGRTFVFVARFALPFQCPTTGSQPDIVCAFISNKDDRCILLQG